MKSAFLLLMITLTLGLSLQLQLSGDTCKEQISCCEEHASEEESPVTACNPFQDNCCGVAWIGLSQLTCLPEPFQQSWAYFQETPATVDALRVHPWQPPRF